MYFNLIRISKISNYYYILGITDIHYLNMLGNWRLIVLLSDSIEIIDPESMQKIIHLDTK